MKHSIAIYLIILILLYLGINGCWAIYEIWKNENAIDPFSSIYALLSMFAAISLFLRKSWSKYLIYLVALLTSGTWLLAILVIFKDGWPYSTVKESVTSLIPGFLLLTVCICGPIVVYKYFKRINQAQRQ